METIRVDILNPRAFNLIKELAELNLIKINKENTKSEFINLIKKIRKNSRQEISLEDITKEVKSVRTSRYEK